MTEYLFTLLTASNPVGKRFDASGAKVEINNNITAGLAEVLIGDIERIGQVIEGLTPSQALARGAPRDEPCVLLTTRGSAIEGTTKTYRGEEVRVISRTSDNFEWPDGPSLLAFDHDPAHWHGAPITSIEDMIDTLGKVLGGIDLRLFDFIARPSSSSYVYDADGNQVTGFRGGHIYLGVDTLAPLAEHGQSVLLDLAAQHGFGNIVLSKAGHMLRRSLFDPSMHGNPSGLIYCSPSDFPEGGHQDRPVTVNQGNPLPLSQLVGMINRNEADSAWATLEEQTRPRAEAARTEYVNTRGAAIDIDPVLLERHLESFTLPGTWILTRDNGEQIPLWQIMVDPMKYHGSTGWRDPIEPEYGSGKAKVFVSTGRVTITSFAHGGQTDGSPFRYSAYFDVESFRAAVEAEPHRWTELAGFTRREDQDGMINVVLELIEDAGSRAEVKATLAGKREEQGTREMISVRDQWRDAYALLQNGSRARILEIGPLMRGHGIKTMSQNTFDLIKDREFNFTPVRPLQFCVNQRILQTYTDLVVKPPKRLGRQVPVVPGMLNIWRPGPKITPSVAEPLLWMKLVHHLVPDETQRETLLDWLAFQLQNPGVKTNWQVVMYSELQGVGKDSLVEPLRWGMGQHNVRDVTPIELESQFNQWLAGGPTLVIMQELDAGNSAASRRRMENMLKPYCAAPPDVLKLNIKNQPQVDVDNTFGVLVFTNRFDLFDLEEGDRRWFMIECAREKLGKQFFRQLWAWYHTGGMRQVCEYLAGRDLSAFDHAVLEVETTYKQAVISTSIDAEDLAIEEYVDTVNLAACRLEDVRTGAMADNPDLKISAKRVAIALHKRGWAPRKAQKWVDGANRTIKLWVKAASKWADTEATTSCELYDYYVKKGLKSI